MQARSSAFCQCLACIVVDETYFIWGWREFRKEYNNIGRLHAIFPSMLTMALLVTLTSNNLEYIQKSLDLTSPVQLCKRPLNYLNITYTVAQINKKGFDELDLLFPATTLIRSAVQKTMIFVDTMSEGIAIAKYLRRQFPPVLQSKAKQIVRTFYADLESNKKIKILEDFINEDIRILIYINAIEMSVNIPNIKRVIQWKVFDFLTFAILVQCIRQASRDLNICAIAVVFLEKKQILPNDISKATANISFARNLIIQDNEQATQLIMKKIYEGNMQICKEERLLPFHYIDLPLLYNINTLGYRQQLSLTCFLDDFAFHLCANELCCDNCNYQSSNPVASIGKVENDQADYKTMSN